jgi:hypothetical protein
VYFQQPGVAEAELDADVRKSLRMMHQPIHLSGSRFSLNTVQLSS